MQSESRTSVQYAACGRLAVGLDLYWVEWSIITYEVFEGLSVTTVYIVNHHRVSQPLLEY